MLGAKYGVTVARFNDEINVYITHQLQSVLSVRKCDLFSKDVMPLFSYKEDYNNSCHIIAHFLEEQRPFSAFAGLFILMAWPFCLQ